MKDYQNPKYEIWTADLSSLYDDAGVFPPSFAEDCVDIDEARAAVKEYQTHDTAAWIKDKETGEIVK